MVICLERGADLHLAQLMSLPLIVSCFTKIQFGVTFLVPGKGPLNGCGCVCVCVCVSVTYQQSVFKQYQRFTYKMTAENGGHSYETELRHCHAMGDSIAECLACYVCVFQMT